MKKTTRQYLKRQRMLTTDYEVFHYSDIALKQVPLHHHDFYECYLFISGDVTYIIEGKSYSLLPGDIILINSKDLHQPIINDNEVPYERIVLWLDKAFLRSLSAETTDLIRCFEDDKRNNVIRANVESQQVIKSILGKLLSLDKYSGMRKDLLYRAYIVELLITLNNILFFHHDKINIEIAKSNQIEEIIQYINDHLEDEIRIDDLVSHFYISKFHLIRKFKKHTGTTIHKYIIQKKLILAKELILKGIPIIQVYKQCGFGDYSNFFRAFKNEYGVTPKQFFEFMNKG